MRSREALDWLEKGDTQSEHTHHPPQSPHLYFNSSFSTMERMTGVLSTTSSNGESDFVYTAWCSARRGKKEHVSWA